MVKTQARALTPAKPPIPRKAAAPRWRSAPDRPRFSGLPWSMRTTIIRVKIGHPLVLFPRFQRFSTGSWRPAGCGLPGRESLSRRSLGGLHVGVDEAARLASPQGGVMAAVPQQLVVRALLDDAAALE